MKIFVGVFFLGSILISINTGFAQTQSSPNIIPNLQILLLNELEIPEPPPADRKMWTRFTSVDDTATLYYGSGSTKIHTFKCAGSGACNESSGLRTAIHSWLVEKGYELDDNHTFRLELDTGAGDGSVELNYYVDKTSNLKGTKSWFCNATIINNCPGKKTWFYTVNVNDGTWRNQ